VRREKSEAEKDRRVLNNRAKEISQIKGGKSSTGKGEGKRMKIFLFELTKRQTKPVLKACGREGMQEKAPSKQRIR